jgi:hypothetical protein
MAAAIGIMMGLFFLLVMLASVVASIIVLIHAFNSSVVEGLLFLFVPFYGLYYLFAKFEHPRKILIIILMLISPFIVGMSSAMAIYGVRKYITNAKTAEGRQGVQRIAADVVAYTKTAKNEQGAALSELPPTSVPVPETLASVSGKKYMSSPREWSQGTWSLIRYTMQDPQYFQYQWQRNSPTTGVARALADLNGDGEADVRVELAVECTLLAGGLDCSAAPQPVVSNDAP